MHIEMGHRDFNIKVLFLVFYFKSILNFLLVTEEKLIKISPPYPQINVTSLESLFL